MRTTLAFMNHSTIRPELVLYQSRSRLPSLSKSAAPTTFQLPSTAWSGEGIRLPVLTVPFISQMTSFCEPPPLRYENVSLARRS